MQSLEGKSLGHYQNLSQVDVGGMATIYKAIDTHLERPVAIKIIRKENFSPSMLDQVLKRFEREAKSLAQLSHPNIVKVIDYGEYESSPYLVLEYLSGGTLKHRLQDGKFTPHQAVGWLIPMAAALAYAHHRGVIHRDVKPSNILFTETNEPMLSDFGIAKILDTSTSDALTGSGAGIGTPEYMAPEQGLGLPVDARTDIYSLAIVLYEILTGRRPFRADTALAVVLKHVNEPLPIPSQYNPDIPGLAEQILVKALAKSPDDRYADMASFSKALGQLVAIYAESPGGSTAPILKESARTGSKQKQEVKPVEATPELEEDTSKLLIRISRLEKVVEESLLSEDFEDANNLISTIEGLGERGRQAAVALRIHLEQTRQAARQRDADISNIRLALPQALESEELTKAEDLLRQLQNLGSKGIALADQYRVAVETSRQQIALRQGEINRLKGLVEQAIAEENFSQVEGLLLSLSVISAQGKTQAARLHEVLEKAQKQAGQRRAEVYRLSRLGEQQIGETNWSAARQTQAQLGKLGKEGKAEAESLGKKIKRAESEGLSKETLQVSLPIESVEASTPAAAPPLEVPAAAEEKQRTTRLWLYLGLAVAALVVLIGGGLAIRALTGSKGTLQSQVSIVTQKELPTRAQEPTAAPTALPTETAAVLLPQPTKTPTQADTENPAASPTSTSKAEITRYEITVDTNNANIRSGPGTVYLIVATKVRGTVLEATGRSQAGDWLVVHLEDGKVGWIYTKIILYSFDAKLLPVVQAPPAPVLPTKKPTESKAGGGGGAEATWTPPPP
jgi:serine/threonine protein kinase